MSVGGQRGTSKPPEIIGESPLLLTAISHVDRAARSEMDINVLIIGESGTGKELLARRFHLSTQRTGDLVCINCANFSEDLLEAELFGVVKGAFTGATIDKKGKLDQANNGTLFLDEIASTSPRVQEKLLRVIQEKAFTRVGGHIVIEVDVRIVAASNQELKKMCEQRTFREDLFYRLNGIPIWIPPLRERGDDAVLIARDFLKRLTENKNGPWILEQSAELVIGSYPWNGNVRELENILRRVCVITDSKIITDAAIKKAIGLDTPPQGLHMQQGEVFDIESIKRSIEGMGPTAVSAETPVPTNEDQRISLTKSERQCLILNLLAAKSSLTASEFRTKTGVSKSTVERDFRELIDSGKVQKQGKSKHIGYALSKQTTGHHESKKNQTGLTKWRGEFTTVLESSITPKSLDELLKTSGRKQRSKFRENVIRPLIQAGLLNMTVPESPQCSRQQYMTTPTGKQLLRILRFK